MHGRYLLVFPVEDELFSCALVDESDLVIFGYCGKIVAKLFGDFEGTADRYSFPYNTHCIPAEDKSGLWYTYIDTITMLDAVSVIFLI